MQRMNPQTGAVLKGVPSVCVASRRAFTLLMAFADAKVASTAFSTTPASSDSKSTDWVW
jgi:hypothetical protein